MPETELRPEGDPEPDASEPREEEEGPARRRRRKPPALPAGDAAPAEAGTARSAPRVLRARHDRAIGGVCGGIAAHYDLDSGFVRLVATLAAFVGGAGFVAYLAALLLLPLESREQARPRPASSPRHDQALLWVGMAIAVASVLFLSRFPFFEFSLLTPRRGNAFPLLLAVLAVLLVARRRSDPVARGALRLRSLARPRHDRLLAGVGSGFARYAGVDANLVRALLLVVAVWSHGIVLLVYLALAALLPEEPKAV